MRYGNQSALPLDEWEEEDGDVLWWRFPIVESPYIGSPLASDWPGYHTHFTSFEVPEGVATRRPPSAAAKIED